ncbi:MAG: PhzF family phenazine biosynthesis protein [Cypionkella sp.]
MTRQWTVDAFADQICLGNPACVVEPLAEWPSDAVLQVLARENNQSETAFLRRSGEPAHYELRWFTPSMEVDLCGHATLAAAHVLLDELALEGEQVIFATRSGELTVRRCEDGYEMDFPADPPRRLQASPGLAEALGVEPVEIWAGRYLIAILESEAAVRRLDPDIVAISKLAGHAEEAGQVVVCALSDTPGVDVVDRFFAPGCGIDEDPATGSAHCILAPLFTEKLGRTGLSFYQAYPGRGARIETEVAGTRVLIRGSAVTVIESRWRNQILDGGLTADTTSV